MTWHVWFFHLLCCALFHKEQNAVPHYFKNQWRIKSEAIKRNKNEYLKGMFGDMEAIQSIKVYVDK
jgi:hypothetical protein